jgi:hypothetical protein
MFDREEEMLGLPTQAVGQPPTATTRSRGIGVERGVV